MSTAKKELTGRHVLYMVLGFFGVVLLANVVFVYLAMDTFTGLATEGAYVKGLSYNDVLEEAEAQDALGWRVEIERQALGPRRWQLTAAFRDREGGPIEDLSVQLEVRRPTQEGFDALLDLAPLGGGRYGVEHEFPLVGQWDLRIVAFEGAAPVYRSEQRAWVK
jgi:nitrogen fixation protein FixH